MTASAAISLFAIAFIGIVLLTSTFFTVKQQSRAIVERFGRYVRTARPGLNVKVPFIDHITQRVSLRVQQLLVEIETTTQDNVFVKVLVAVQYRVAEGSEADSYYRLQDHQEQIKSYVLDVVRAKVPKMSLDEVFERKDDIGTAVKTELDASMKIYGFEIPNALVTDVNPADNVKSAMNEINTQQRLQVAAAAKGEANKILVVKNAEAEAESTGSKVILIPHAPGGMADISEQLRNAIMTASEAGQRARRAWTRTTGKLIAKARRLTQYLYQWGMRWILVHGTGSKSPNSALRG